MPIIKDKYKAKSDRLTPLIKRENVVGAIDTTTTLSTSQLQSIATQDARNNINALGAGSASATSLSSNVLDGKISGYSLTTTDSLENVFTLNSNERLNNIIISYEHTSERESIVGLYWSIYSPKDIDNTVSGGKITSSDDRLYRIISTTFIEGTSLSLYELCQGFENIGKEIYFYGLSSAADSRGVMFTFLVG